MHSPFKAFLEARTTQWTIPIWPAKDLPEGSLVIDKRVNPYSDPPVEVICLIDGKLWVVRPEWSEVKIQNLECVPWGKHSSEHNKERWRQGKKIGKPKRHFICDAKDCNRPSKAKGLCTMHYQRRKAALKAVEGK